MTAFARLGSRALTALLVLAVVTAACSSPRVIDGWELGGVEACADTPFGGDNTVPCDVQMREILAVARARLDQRDPGHPAVVRAQIHSLGSRGGGAPGVTVVVVFDFAGGATSAIGVGHRVLGASEEHDPAWVAVDYGALE